MEDAFVISCHETQKEAKWSESRDSHQTCSICGSLHPFEFSFQLLNNGFIRGWHWTEDGNPDNCETDGGIFHASHLLDMSEDWLFANAQLIFDHTGVAFFWEKEAIHMWCPFIGIKLGEGSAIELSHEQRIVAGKLLSEKYYSRRIS